MKRILNIGILLFVLVAFSGLASASWVTDHDGRDYWGYNSVYTLTDINGFNTRTLMDWKVVHYSKNHIRYYFKRTNKLWNYDNTWITISTSTYYRDYKKISYNKIIEKGYSLPKGKYFSNKKWTVKTKHSVYDQYKKEYPVYGTAWK